MSDTCIIFDLDDTLYKEIDFVKSGFKYIEKVVTKKGIVYSDIYALLLEAYCKGKNAFEEINNTFGLDIPIPKYLEWYRFHYPTLSFNDDCGYILKCLEEHGIPMGLISDGRSITQRNKIKALGLDQYFDEQCIVISEEFGSEKPSVQNYQYFVNLYPNIARFVYVGDNPKKDFITPNKLGWLTIGIKDNGENIHIQSGQQGLHNPQLWIESLVDILDILNIN